MGRDDQSQDGYGHRFRGHSNHSYIHVLGGQNAYDRRSNRIRKGDDASWT